MTLLVRDEADLVGANMEFHLAAGVDFVIVTDNRSVDGTTALLRRYEKAGVARVIHETDDDYSQGRWVTRMAQLAAREYDADWVINNDADEFWWPRHGDLASTLAAVPEDVEALCAWRYNLVARPDDDQPPWMRMTVRQAHSMPPPGIESSTFAPKVCHRGHPSMGVGQGAHWVAVDGQPNLDPLDDGRIEIFHLPIRSKAQYENKIVLGGGAYAKNKELGYATGNAWRDWHTIQRRGQFDEAYQRLVLSEEDVQAGLASGDLVEDTRLRDRLETLRSDLVVPGALEITPPGLLARAGRRVALTARTIAHRARPD